MAVGRKYEFRCHENSLGVIELDQIRLIPFTHADGGGAITITVVRDDLVNTPNDAWIVNIIVEQGSLGSFGAIYSQGDMIDDCTNAINAAFGSSGAGANTPSSGFL